MVQHIILFIKEHEMYYVYVLKSSKGRLYVGYTSDLKRRIAEHNAGQSQYTRNDTWELIYYEAYRSEHDARDRERKYKQYGQSYRRLKERIKDSLISE